MKVKVFHQYKTKISICLIHLHLVSSILYFSNIDTNRIGSFVVHSGMTRTVRSAKTREINFGFSNANDVNKKNLTVDNGPQISKIESMNVNVVLNMPNDSVDEYGNVFHLHCNRFMSTE